MDYASFLLEAKKNLKSYEEAMVNKNFKEAKEYAFNLLAEVRLLEVIARDAEQKR
jgi:hypothetical protein